MRELLKRDGLLHGDAPDRRRPDDRRDRRATRRRPRARRSSSRSRRRSSRPAAWRSSAARSPRTAASSSSPATSARLHRGPARVFDSETACFEAVKDRRIVPGDVVVIRYEGPVGGPGHAGDAERHRARSSARASATGRAHHRRPVLGRDPRPDDRPHRARGGARRPDRDRRGGRRDRHRRRPQGPRPRGRPDEIARRLAAWTPRPPHYATGVLAKYAALVGSASQGAVTTGPRMRRTCPARTRPRRDGPAHPDRDQDLAAGRRLGRRSTPPGRASASTRSSSRSG